MTFTGGRDRALPFEAGRSAALAAAGTLGALAALWMLASQLLGWGIVVVASGSMRPALEVGDAALVVPVAAADIKTGWIVTVPRQGDPPTVTHRVVEVGSSVLGGAYRDLVLQGDANDIADPLPYRLQSAHRVVLSAPWIGSALVALRSPVAIAITTLVVAALVASAFWPRALPQTDRRTSAAETRGVM